MEAVAKLDPGSVSRLTAQSGRNAPNCNARTANSRAVGPASGAPMATPDSGAPKKAERCVAIREARIASKVRMGSRGRMAACAPVPV